MIDKLKSYLDDLKKLRKDINAENVKQIAKKNLRNRAEQLGVRWFREFNAVLSDEIGISQEILNKYSNTSGRLINLSAPSNLTSSYRDTLNTLVKDFRKEIILPAQKGHSTTLSLSLLHNILSNLPDANENEYLKEAISCAQRGFFRAAVVLGWCATIDRIHRRIENVGLAKFNVTSAQMASQAKGRYRQFNTPQNINSINELRGVFDKIILRIVEGMGMIDTNQHTRLGSCFDMRCQCAHPGEAPVTEYNLISYFSDINEIVFQNPMFEI